MKNDYGLNNRKYSLISNVIYCMKNTANCYPLLFLWGSIAILINLFLPLLTTFLPKVVIEAITENVNTKHLILVTLFFTVSIALLSAAKKFIEKMIYWHRFKMNSFYLRMVAHKGLTTDYPNQENDHFRKLQSESFGSCNGNYSPLTQIYDTLIVFFSGLLGFTVYLGLLSQFNLFVVFFLIVTTIFSYFLNGYIVKWTEKHNDEKIAYSQKINYISDVSGDLRSAKDIRLYHMAVWLDQVYKSNITGLNDWYKRYRSKVFGVSMADSGLSLLREGVAYAYLIYMVLTSKMDVADFVLYFGIITGFSAWLSGLLGQINILNRINMSFNFLRNYLEYPEKFKSDNGLTTKKLYHAPKTIELRNVSYRYEGIQTDTLHNINLTIHPSEHLAIVGLNGAGKTTLVKLICGLTDPTEGEILYDGVNVKEYNRKEFYRLFSAVFQQYSLMPVPIENIVAESLSEQIDHEKVQTCLHTAGLLSKIEALPHGVQSEYGKTIFDDGIELSGGEVQKLLLARALYKNAPVMILDEPTAALDPISESNLYEIYNCIMKGKTTVFISHRLASTQFCERILLIENGEIIEQGSHDCLLALKGKYFELFETQARYYREHPEGEEIVS